MTINIIADPTCDRLVREQVEVAKNMEMALFEAFKKSNPNFIKKGSKIKAHANQGGIGHVFDITDADSIRLILKLAKEQPSGIDDKPVQARFNKELWVSTRPWLSSRPPKVIAVGEVCLEYLGCVVPYAFILQEFSPYIPAYEGLIARKDILDFVTSVGRLSAEIHSIRTSGFGECFSLDKSRFAFETWMGFVDDIASEVFWRDSIFYTSLNATQKKCIDMRVADLRVRECESRLFHGDCIANWGNLLVDIDSREIKTVIDWEYAGGGDAFVVDMGTTLCTLHERMLDQSFINCFFERFLSGYGMSKKRYSVDFKRDVETFAVIRALNKIRESPRDKLRADRARNLERLVHDLVC